MHLTADRPTVTAGTGAVLGARICAVAGLVWLAWGAGVLPPAVGMPLFVAGLAAAFVVLRAVRHGHTEGTGRPALDGTYWSIVTGEVVAIVSGLIVLDNVLDAPQANAGWIALVVGLHFFALSRVFPAERMVPLGVLVSLAGAAGLVAAAAGAGMAGATAAAAIPAGVVLLGSAGMVVRRLA